MPHLDTDDMSSDDDDCMFTDEDELEDTAPIPALSQKDMDIMVVAGLAKQVMDDLNELRSRMVAATAKVKEIQKRIDGIQKEDRKALHEFKRHKPAETIPPDTSKRSTRLSAKDIKEFRSIIDAYKLRLETAEWAMDLVHVSEEPRMGAKTPGLSPDDARKESTNLRYQFRKDFHTYFKRESERLRMLCDKRKV